MESTCHERSWAVASSRPPASSESPSYSNFSGSSPNLRASSRISIGIASSTSSRSPPNWEHPASVYSDPTPDVHSRWRLEHLGSGLASISIAPAAPSFGSPPPPPIAHRTDSAQSIDMSDTHESPNLEDLTPEEANRIIHSHRKVRYGKWIFSFVPHQLSLSLSLCWSLSLELFLIAGGGWHCTYVHEAPRKTTAMASQLCPDEGSIRVGCNAVSPLMGNVGERAIYTA